MWQRTCNECVYCGGTICAVTQQPTTPNNNACASFSNVPYECAICHRPIFHKDVIYDSKTNQIVCHTCCDRLSSCNNCDNGRTCLFESSPSKTPKQIQKQFRQGNMIGQTVIKNPDRIEETCKKDCPCWDSINECCNRTLLHYCDNIKETI